MMWINIWFPWLQEILKVIMERGPQFTEQEYTTLLSLNHRSLRSAKEGGIQSILDALSRILTDCSKAQL
jgi:exocyst complex component 4